MIAACGGGDGKDKAADAGPSFDGGATIDGGGGGACPEFTTPAGVINTFPGMFSGSLTGAGADFDVAEGVCADERLFFPQIGEDLVVQLDGLTPGSSYVVSIQSGGDVSFYVASGCTSPTLEGECLLFSDQVELDAAEIGDFVAPANGTAFVVVDSYYEAADLPDGTFTVTVAEPECTVDAECTDAAAPFCSNNTCVACLEDYDCTDAAAPVCGAAGACEAGTAECTDDVDDVIQDNDGPAGATPLTSGVPSAAAICNTPDSERDFFSITLADTADLDVSVAFADVEPNDLDVNVLTADGTPLGFTFYQNPETVNLTYLPAGDYLIEVEYFGAPVTAALAYTVTATVTDNGDCATATDCAAEFSTQFYRGSCDVATGACSDIAGAGALAQGEACDSPDDCTSGICSNGLAFQANAQDSVCTIACTATADCAALGGFTCTVPLQENFCRPACVGNLDCGANVGSENLDAGEPWDYLTCTAGSCDLDPAP